MTGSLKKVEANATVLGGGGSKIEANPQYYSADTGPFSATVDGWAVVPNVVATGVIDPVASVSAEITKGDAKFRVASVNVAGVGDPASVRFNSPE